MIVFDLRCEQCHVFEGWFGSSEDYHSQSRRGLLACPLCESKEIGKAPMAPRVAATGEEGPTLSSAEAKKLLAEMAGLQRKMLEKSDFVGDRFPDEARAIHLGETEARAIHGRATPLTRRACAMRESPSPPCPSPSWSQAKATENLRILCST